ncbi:MAG: hypothetical protein KF708_23185 [Pirellulales bacterium]|nr:hypothetical protein [Pirellulales bacterium]
MKARENPFAVDRVLEIRYELPGESLDDLLARLERLGGRGAIVGPHGSGKTTLLEDIAARLERRGQRVYLLRLSAERRTIPRETMCSLSERLGAQDAVLCDGAEQLNPLAWRRFRFRVRQAGVLIATTHCAGRLPTLLETRTTPELLESIVRRLLNEPAAVFPFSVPALFARHAGNVRDALRELYDRYAHDEYALDFTSNQRNA